MTKSVFINVMFESSERNIKFTHLDNTQERGKYYVLSPESPQTSQCYRATRTEELETPHGFYLLYSQCF